MTGILLDLSYQLAILAAFTCALILTLCLIEWAREAYGDWKALSTEIRAAERLDRQARIERYQRITREVIAERRR